MDLSQIPEFASTAGIAVLVIWFLLNSYRDMQKRLDENHRYYLGKLEEQREKHAIELRSEREEMKKDCGDRITRLERAFERRV